MPSFASLGKFFGRTASEGAAFAAGIAVAPTLAPVVRELENLANSKYESHPISAGEAAGIVAEDVEQFDFGKTEASYNGVNETRFRALLGETLNAPGVGELYEAYRRDLIDDAMFEHGLRKAKLETMWDEPLKALKELRVSVQDVAVMVQRGILPNPGWLPVGPPTAVGKVPPMPQASFDPVAEAQAQGFDEDRAAALAKIIGLPASPDLAARMVFRNIIDRVDFDRAISEGNTRNEWSPFLFDGFREIPTAHDGIEGRLRGWIDDAGMYAQTARHGMSQEDTDLLFKITGRPLSFHQAFIGARRGGTLDGDIADIPEYFLKALRESNIRPEWYALAWAQRFTYPSTFVLRALTEAGDLTADETNTILLYEGWEPKLADKVSKRWAATVAGTKTNKQVASAQTKLITATHKAYIGGVLDDAGAGAVLGVAGLTPEVTKEVLYFWAEEKQVDNLPGPAAPPVVA